MILSGDLVFRVHFVVVLLQSVCITTVASAAATVTVSTATKTSSTTNTTTTGNGIIGGAGPPSYNSSCGDSIPAVPDSPRVPDSRAYYDKLRPVIAMQKYHLFGELGQTCSATEDCRQYAYECGDRKQICECAKGYRPDEDRRTCVGAIGKRCQYDAHCITNAYCKGQMICTCKREYEYHSEDKWSCQASAADSMLLLLRFRRPVPPFPPHLVSRKSTPTSWLSTMMTTTTRTLLPRTWSLLVALLGSGGGAIIIPLVLVSSWQLKINLFTV
ncbi:uncharacterized protein LOC131676689 isoform X1 [Topomyia yanbarensis]|uniref:uncharacterized protein LOC131676689 isoform X1 n=1 Tax=Topomyia yanbarensis TaxID=2498891 RepID=UPI00273AB763|nr:uncharacterized protein LOC131676689 isoform X1 [Topomyia yanbarensis]XP_058811923.1 uncharacterized protein LOC131676689 isoform X1 [Topomyia yanbarensis]